MEVTKYNIYVKTYTQSVFQFVYKLTSDKDVAKDILQDTFLKLWENGSQVNSEKIKSWVFTTAYRLSLDYLEKRNKHVNDEVLLVHASPTKDPHDLKELIDIGLSNLSQLQKSSLLLRDYEGYTYSEIAEILNISEDSVKVHLFRARFRMKEYIRDIKIIL